MRINGRKRGAVSGVAALGLAAAGILFGAGPAAAAYSDCPDGQACVFTGSDGNGQWSQAAGCGTFNMNGPIRKAVSSVRTHGNAVSLFDENGAQVGFVDRWTQTNLSLAENDRATLLIVHCP